MHGVRAVLMHLAVGRDQRDESAHECCGVGIRIRAQGQVEAPMFPTAAVTARAISPANSASCPSTSGILPSPVSPAVVCFRSRSSDPAGREPPKADHTAVISIRSVMPCVPFAGAPAVPI
ncbi:hypothetical protein GCM10027059_50060 [Myceligenerans halotolerans]